jgi:hypothetical protein
MSKPMIFLCCLMSSSLKPTARPRCLRTYTIRAVPANTNDSIGWPWGLSRRVTGREGHGASTPWSPYYDNNILIYSYFIFFYIPYIGNNHPNWLIFFRGVETTNQYTFICLYHFLWFLMIVGLKLWVIYVVNYIDLCWVFIIMEFWGDYHRGFNGGPMEVYSWDTTSLANEATYVVGYSRGNHMPGGWIYFGGWSKVSRGFQVNPSFDCQLWEDFPLFS